MAQRIYRVSRGPADRDPLFPGVWISPAGDLPKLPDAAPVEFTLLPEPPISEEMKKWKALVEIAEPVKEILRQDGEVDHDMLLQVVKDIVQNNLDVDDIAALYRDRKGRSHG